MTTTNRHFRSDADGASFVSEQLQYISPRIVETLFAMPEWAKHLPLETGSNPAVREMGFDIYTAAGMAEIFEGDGRNLPEVGIARERVMSQVFNIGVNRSMADTDIEAAALEASLLRSQGMTNPITLEEGKERAQAQAVAMTHEDIALNGLPANNIVGLLTQPNIGSYPAPVGASSSALWELKTGPEIVADLTALISLVMTTAKVADYYPDRLVLPLNKYLIASTVQMPGTAETALSFFQRTNPMGTKLKIDSWQRLNGKGTGGTGIAFAYKFDEDVISYRSPRVYYIHTPPARAPAGWTWTHSGRTAGVGVKRPFAVAKMQGF